MSLLVAALAAAGPLALAALGGLFTEAAGSLSIALEGCIGLGGFAAAAAARGAAFGGAAPAAAAALGLAAGILAGGLLGLLVGLAAERLGADVFVAGLAANLLAAGLGSLLSGALFGTKGVVAAPELGLAAAGLPAPGLDFLLALLAAAFLSLLFGATAFGLRVRAAGDRGEAAAAAGLDRGRLRVAAHLLAGAAAGLAGALLASRIAAFVPGMASGRGWIALVAVYLGGRRAGGVLLASLGFGLLIALANAGQALAGLPAELLMALPYLGTALALLASRAALRRKGAP